MTDGAPKPRAKGAAARVVHWSAAAQSDLTCIVDYIASRDPIQAEQVLAQLQSQAHGLERFAERGRRIPELRGSRHGAKANWRELLVKPWRIVYAVEDNKLLVLAVVDGRRDFVAWLARQAGTDLFRPLD
jgi:toxin ParE1/3/4